MRPSFRVYLELRENMTRIMLLYPFLLGLLGKYLIEGDVVEGYVMGVIAVMFAIITGFCLRGGGRLLVPRRQGMAVRHRSRTLGGQGRAACDAPAAD